MNISTWEELLARGVLQGGGGARLLLLLLLLSQAENDDRDMYNQYCNSRTSVLERLRDYLRLLIKRSVCSPFFSSSENTYENLIIIFIKSSLYMVHKKI